MTLRDSKTLAVTKRRDIYTVLQLAKDKDASSLIGHAMFPSRLSQTKNNDVDATYIQ